MAEYISPKQLSERFNVSLDTIYTYINEKKLSAIHIGKIIKIPVNQLEINELKRGVTPRELPISQAE
jgi:excisionase family DNA binding protein